MRDEQYEEVMKLLLSFITKEKHCEMLLDKLCQRIASVEWVAFLNWTNV